MKTTPGTRIGQGAFTVERSDGETVVTDGRDGDETGIQLIGRQWGIADDQVGVTVQAQDGAEVRALEWGHEGASLRVPVPSLDELRGS